MDQTYLDLSLEQWFCLSFIDGVGPTRLARLYTYLKTLETDQVATPLKVATPLQAATTLKDRLDIETLQKLKWPKPTAIHAMAFLHSNVLPEDAEKKREVTKHWLQAHEQHHIVFRDDDRFPRLLREIPVAPTFLYVQGHPAVLQHQTCLGVVGARRASSFGRKTTQDWSATLASKDICIVSGGAMGVDTYAHQGALDVQGKTVVVMGTGLLNLYPKQNIELFTKIVEQGGVLVSEYPLTTEVRAHLFPPRNRIISGISSGVLVVEASERSGSLISAKYALEQNRTVYAVPGHIGDTLASGPNALIRQGATLVRSANDLLEDLESPFMSYAISSRSFRDSGYTSSLEPVSSTEPAFSTSPLLTNSGGESVKGTFDVPVQNRLPDYLSEDAKTVFSHLDRERVGLDFDELIRLTNWPAPNLMQTLMELELNSLISNQQGMYLKC
ncbi:DNA-processing protein DprA [Marinomonas mediterranea]|uniref:DNA-processing protein DprA n=1 Tax=Marinomonas mediterranea TaxID=119864 RepID=UPI0023491ABA|nr:DNA-processing protein DprA [Marinomonas mediterranea]WCN07425.1 DNA-protecting protein DprA [Marinomonas mediterranea]